MFFSALPPAEEDEEEQELGIGGPGLGLQNRNSKIENRNWKIEIGNSKMGSKPFQAVMSNCYVIENTGQRRLTECCAEKKMLKTRFKAIMLLKTNNIVLVQSHFLGSKPFLGGSSAQLCHWKQISWLQSRSRGCGSKPFLRFKAISGKRDVRIGIWGGRLMKKDSEDVIPSLRSELALSPFASLRVNSANGAGSERSEGSRVSQRPAKKIGLSGTVDSQQLTVQRQWLQGIKEGALSSRLSISSVRGAVAVLRLSSYCRL